MKPFTAADTLSLPIEERIALVEDIWDTIAEAPEAVALTGEEKAIIDERLQAFHQNPHEGSPLEEVYQRIKSER